MSGGYKVGLDFGTTNSTVSYLENSDPGPKVFRYPGPDGYEYIPSCVAYDNEGKIHIGRAALDWAADPEATYCSNLKMILPLSDTEREKYSWTRRYQPEAVIVDYFRHILNLDEAQASSFTIQKGPIDGIVLSVPHIWAKSLEHPGRSRLQKIVAEGIGLPLIQLISEPVAAAAYYAHRYQQIHLGTPFVGNVLICDMGGGTFDVTLCRIEPGKIEELHNDGNGRVELGKAGVRFDRRLILDGLKRKGQELDDNSPDFHELYIKLQDFKVNNHRHITQNLVNAIEDADLWDKVILRAGSRLTFNYRDIQAAFQEIGDGITEVLARFKAVIDDQGYPLDMVFFVGGFSEFYLVREHIKHEVLKMAEDSPRLIEDLNKENVRYAISCGAALVANELIAVEEKFEHTIGVVGYVLKTIGDGTPELIKQDKFLPVIKGGGRLSDYQDVHWADREIKVHEESPQVPIYLDPESKNRVIRVDPSKLASIRLPNFGLAANQWRVGMRINRSKVVYLVFEDARGNRVECELGDIVRQVFCGIEIVD